MNLCRGYVKMEDGAKISRLSWKKDRLTFLVYRLFTDPNDHMQAIDKYVNGKLEIKNWTPTAEEMFADDWRVLRGAR